jgi:hypothetical protein
MNSTTITCEKCGAVIDITEALQHQMREELQKQSEAQNEALRKQYEAEAADEVAKAVEAALEKQNQQAESEKAKLQAQLELVQKRANDEAELALQKAQSKADAERSKLEAQLEIEREKAKNAAELAADTERQKQEIETQKLRSQIEAEKESNKKFQEELKSLLEKLAVTEKEKETVEIKAREQLREREKLIREEAAKKANEDNYTKIREQEETIRKLNEQLTEAKQVAEQGSQQLQGEILELDLEKSLNANFKFDFISEVKKGEYGADVRQIVNDPSIQNCGLILWECKNAKNWSEKWVDKIKEELILEKAQIGVIVWSSANNDEDYKQLDDNVWVVKPQYAVMIGAALRDAIIKVCIVNRNNEGRDVKTELIYTYLTSGEFANRIKAIIDTYDKMHDALKKEKKQAQSRWAEQEKLFDSVTANLMGMSGDLKGIAGREIIALPEFA